MCTKKTFAASERFHQIRRLLIANRNLHIYLFIILMMLYTYNEYAPNLYSEEAHINV